MKVPLAIVGLLLCRLAAFASAYEPPAPSGEIEVLRFEWHDAARDRDVPAKIYLPKDGTKPLPVIVFSHGLGGSREGTNILGDTGQDADTCLYISSTLAAMKRSGKTPRPRSGRRP